MGWFRGLEDAEQMRDRIRARLVRHKGAGLGDEDDVEEVDADEPASEASEVAGQLLEEVRALRAAVLAARRRSVPQSGGSSVE